MNLKERARNLKTDIPAIFIAMKKKETSIAAKIIAVLTIVYTLSPIDLIPDFIPVLGFLDDIIVLPALVALTIRMIPPDCFEACRKEAEGLWSGGKPKKWYYALPIVALWLLIVFFIVRAVLKGV
jgi:uncharacterized membrane protein YkvA (DUF1232 family)